MALNPHIKAVLRGLCELGQSEKVGIVFNNPRIVQYWSLAKVPDKVKDDEVAWCAAFHGMCYETTGQAGTKSGLAKSYLKWGIQLPEPKLFCTAVLNRANDPLGKEYTGHVGFVVGIKANSVVLLGGNQGNKVSIAEFSKSRVHASGYRWINTATPFVDDNFMAPLSASGEVSDR